ncbi:Z-ring associated protein ZapG [Pantoea sp. Nvir]|uniref:Z-ring associated protein ZapG n=1 Tax=Pantoea sp. Nvir TaxID=2576760 RepID=UPI0013579C0C|nr:Z-ring associated protein ZapG [Pantoea sp. Nvir]MXP66459.1 DUF1043 family protein [Pantoea sp. Nvir]CAJ0993393.1 Inner membrane protein YhcB [Pantoea sp. Nvir]
MTWEYGLIGLVIGTLVGAVAMRFGNKKIRKQRSLLYELEKTKAELADYRKELNNYFLRSTELLDNMVHDHHQFYQHIVKGSNDLLSNPTLEKNTFAYQLTQAEADNDQVLVQIPRDYSESASGMSSDKRTGRD